MKVLLDECPPIDFRHHLPGREVHTAEWAGIKSIKNGQILQQAESAGYEVFLTVDQGVPRQRNLAQRKISVLIICSRTNWVSFGERWHPDGDSHDAGGRNGLLLPDQHDSRLLGGSDAVEKVPDSFVIRRRDRGAAKQQTA